MNTHDSLSTDAGLREEALHLPVPGLFADVDLGFGAVALNDGFQALPVERRQRILRDWSTALKAEADRALVEMYREHAERHKGRSIVQQIDRFRRSCKTRGIHCPTDFAVLLQQV